MSRQKLLIVDHAPNAATTVLHKPSGVKSAEALDLLGVEGPACPGRIRSERPTQSIWAARRSDPRSVSPTPGHIRRHCFGARCISRPTAKRARAIAAFRKRMAPGSYLVTSAGDVGSRGSCPLQHKEPWRGG